MNTPANDAISPAPTAAARKWLWVPNVITLLRFLLTAAFPFAGPGWRAGLVVGAGLSDFADGYLARRFHLTSWIGGILDAIADKAFILTALITYLAEGQLQWWQLLLLLSRDLCVLFVAIYVALGREWSAFKDMASRLFGKLTTALLFPYLIAVALAAEPHLLVTILFIACAALSVIAGADYLVKFVRAVRGQHAAKRSDSK